MGKECPSSSYHVDGCEVKGVAVGGVEPAVVEPAVAVAVAVEPAVAVVGDGAAEHWPSDRAGHIPWEGLREGADCVGLQLQLRCVVGRLPGLAAR